MTFWSTGVDRPTYDPLEARVAKLEGLFEGIEKRLSNVEAELRALRASTRTQFFWLLGVIILGLLVPIVLQVL